MSVNAVLVKGMYPGWMAGGLAPGYETEPDPFIFAAQQNVALSTADVTSNAITVQGLTFSGATVTLTGDVSAEYRKNAGLWATAPTTANEGDSFEVRVDASGSYSTSVSATLTIYETDSIFRVTTIPDPATVADGDVVTSVRKFRERR